MDSTSVVAKTHCEKCNVYFYGDFITICPYCAHPVIFVCKADVNYLKQFEMEEDVCNIIVRQPRRVEQLSFFKRGRDLEYRVTTP